MHIGVYKMIFFVKICSDVTTDQSKQWCRFDFDIGGYTASHQHPSTRNSTWPLPELGLRPGKNAAAP